MESIFTRVFAYRQREHHSPTENFITEILAFCLETDEIFCKDFLKLFINTHLSWQEMSISTQESYLGYGRPDIEINFADTSIIVECKVESPERQNQLNDYASILTTKKLQSNKYIIFLTKYFEHKAWTIQNVNFKLIRWYEIYLLIDERHTEITKQFKSFLKDQEMENLKNFTIQDMLALKTIRETISKMEEILEELRPEFEEKFGNYSREKTLESSYNGYTTLRYESNVYYLAVGFLFYDDIEIPTFGIWFNIPRKKLSDSKLVTILKEELIQKSEWKLDDGEISPYLLKPITDFLDKENDCIPAMKTFILQGLSKLYEIKNNFKGLLTP